GGNAGSFLEVALAIEEISRVDPGTALYVHVQNSLVVKALLYAGNVKQRQKYLPRLVEGRVGAYAVSEAGAGSDAFSMATHAIPTSTGYTLNGQKCWTSGAAEADLFLVFAKVVDG